MNRKLIVVGLIIFLLVGVNVSGDIDTKETSTVFDGNILYVGGSGANNYTSIQEAINNASEGDTVYVYNYSSPYYQNVFIEKKINLIGQDKETTIIDGEFERDVVKIYESFVNLSGFTIRNSGRPPLVCAGVEIFNDLQYINVYDNYIMNNNQGIDNYDNQMINIYNNIFIDNYDGIDFFYGKRCQVYNNLFLKNSNGINFFGTEGHSNMIYNNTFKDNIEGISIFRYQFATMHSNNFINNSCHASFTNDLRFLFNIRNKQTWYDNYWDDCIGENIKFIEGEGIFKFFIIDFRYPIYDFDKSPVSEPYDIEVL